MYIYDPSFEHQMSTITSRQQKGKDARIAEYTWMSKAIQLRHHLRQNGNKAIDEIWMGGGGNHGGTCQDMACKWLYGEIRKDMGNASKQVRTNFVKIPL
jgi:hypothetical protein